MPDHPHPNRLTRNGTARALFEEARRAGLVQRHLRKLHHLARHPHPPTANTPRPTTNLPTAEQPAQPTKAPRPPGQLTLGIDVARRPATPPRRPSTKATASDEAA